MAIGKLYRFNDGQFMVKVDYQFHDESKTGWWGELTLTEYQRLDGGEYVIKLEDGRLGRCFLKKKVNKAVSGLQPLYRYHFRGYGLLK